MKNFKILFDQMRQRLQKGDLINPIEVSVSSECIGGFKSKVSIRDFDIIIDQPKSFGGSNFGPKPSEIALAALTTIPANKLGLLDQLGTLDIGKLGYLVITDNDYFHEKSKILSTSIKLN